MKSIRCILDASSALSYTLNKKGGEAVSELLENSAMHAVTWTEMLTQLSKRSDIHAPDKVAARLKKIIFIDVGQEEDSKTATKIAQLGPQSGLSLGDKYAIAMSYRLNIPVVTAHSHWENLELKKILNKEVKIYSIRNI